MTGRSGYGGDDRFREGSAGVGPAFGVVFEEDGRDTFKEYLATLKNNVKAYLSENAVSQRVTACIAAAALGVQTSPNGAIWWAARVKDCIQAAVKKP